MKTKAMKHWTAAVLSLMLTCGQDFVGMPMGTVYAMEESASAEALDSNQTEVEDNFGEDGAGEGLLLRKGKNLL